MVALSVSELALMILTELPTPLVRLVKVLLPAPEAVKVLELIIFVGEPVTPFTEVVRVLMLDVFATVLMIGCKPLVTPLTVDVTPFSPLLTRVFVVEPDSSVETDDQVGEAPRPWEVSS